MSIGVLAVLATILLFAGCAVQAASPTASPTLITVSTGPAERIRKICLEAVSRVTRGCVLSEGSRVIVFCPYNDARCLAEGLQAAVEPPIDESRASASP